MTNRLHDRRVLKTSQRYGSERRLLGIPAKALFEEWNRSGAYRKEYDALVPQYKLARDTISHAEVMRRLEWRQRHPLLWGIRAFILRNPMFVGVGLFAVCLIALTIISDFVSR